MSLVQPGRQLCAGEEIRHSHVLLLEALLLSAMKLQEA